MNRTPMHRTGAPRRPCTPQGASHGSLKGEHRTPHPVAPGRRPLAPPGDSPRTLQASTPQGASRVPQSTPRGAPILAPVKGSPRLPQKTPRGAPILAPDYAAPRTLETYTRALKGKRDRRFSVHAEHPKSISRIESPVYTNGPNTSSLSVNPTFVSGFAFRVLRAAFSKFASNGNVHLLFLLTEELVSNFKKKFRNFLRFRFLKRSSEIPTD